ncbi:monooxygenase [Wolfiporia cocos MD-104 SS10]|uniref:Monooxygenase n=1 Tax=Wolfiporia cocos (strain MD-104) TaxID=742152 RepID=A0A2H3JD08_WOLCO|nr:monooxygenase [Wolfiporia cocos MD-104 SS10]
MSSSQTQVLIAGAGPAGLVLALTLIKNGISVRIIDKEYKYCVGQRGAGIMPRSLELYNFLGILPDIQTKALLPPEIKVYKLPGGKEVLKTFRVDAPLDPTPSIPYINVYVLGQSHVESILRSHLAQYGCHVELGTELQMFEQYTDHVVAQVARKVGDGEEPETITARWLVGTDGARGIVRKKLGLSFLGETRGIEEHFVIGDVKIKGIGEEYKWHSWGDMSTRMLMLRQTEEEGLYQLLGAGQIDHARVASNREDLVRFLREASGRNDLELTEIVWLSEYTPNIRMVNKFGEGRVFVAGDAAHVHSPTGGQGLNSSVQDSFNLGWKLALVEKGLASPSLLDTYTEERLPVVAQMLKKTGELLDKTVGIKNNAGHEAAWQRGGPLKQLGVNYRWSSIVLDERTPVGSEDKEHLICNAYGGGDGICAGDRAPDVPGLVSVKTKIETLVLDGQTTSLFRIFSPSAHTVIIFAPNIDAAAPIIEAVKPYPQQVLRSVLILPAGQTGENTGAVADIVLSDRDGHAYGGYAIARDGITVVIVRPDGVIGGIVFGREGVRRYFKTAFSAAV